MTEALWAPGTSFASALAEAAALTDTLLDKLITAPDGLEARVFTAMRYAALGPGKRLRPFLALASAKLFAVATGRALQVAAAIEMVHAYSLVHDDLPAMDNSDLRRGRATCHKALTTPQRSLPETACSPSLSKCLAFLTPTRTRPCAASWWHRWRKPRAATAWSAAR